MPNEVQKFQEDNHLDLDLFKEYVIQRVKYLVSNMNRKTFADAVKNNRKPNRKIKTEHDFRVFSQPPGEFEISWYPGMVEELMEHLEMQLKLLKRVLRKN
jgi:hypothetical protein